MILREGGIQAQMLTFGAILDMNALVTGQELVNHQETGTGKHQHVKRVNIEQYIKQIIIHPLYSIHSTDLNYVCGSEQVTSS